MVPDGIEPVQSLAATVEDWPAASRAAEEWYPRQDSNLCPWLRRPVLYPLSYGGP
jgi:hypothetical protein